MNDFEFHLAPIREICRESFGEKKLDLCKSFLSHVDAVIFDTRSALLASSESSTNGEKIRSLIDRLYEENHRIGNLIENLIDENSIEIRPSNDENFEQALRKIDAASEENFRDEEKLFDQIEKSEIQRKTIEHFLKTTEILHDEAMKNFRFHVAWLREKNAALKAENEKIENFSKKLPETLFFSS